MTFYCGNSICKKPLEVASSDATSWPLRCKGCGLSLYPEDLLEAVRRDELELRPGVLMWDKGGRRVAVMSSDLLGARQPSKIRKAAGTPAEASVEDVLAMVQLPDDETKPQRAGGSSTRIWLIAAVVLIAAIVLALLLKG